MLKTRVITAVVLLAILLPILYFGSALAFSVVAVAFFGAGMWECQRLFRKPAPVFLAVLWALFFAYFCFHPAANPKPFFGMLFIISVVAWCLMFLPMLRVGLPAFDRPLNGILGSFYALSVFACFAAMQVMFAHSPLFLLSAMSLVWVADVGAYFSGKQFGKRKLAPSISPGKTWEGVIGGLLSVLLVATLFAMMPALADSFSAKLLQRLGWIGFVAVLVAVTAASVCGDLFESMLKRRADMKDSSHLLPGHGGVLDRVDALIPVLPLMALLDLWW